MKERRLERQLDSNSKCGLSAKGWGRGDASEFSVEAHRLNWCITILNSELQTHTHTKKTESSRRGLEVDIFSSLKEGGLKSKES